MSNYRCVNFYDLCRLCTACSDEKLNIFSEEGKSKDLSSKIAECLPLVVDEKDRLPKVLCPQCVQHVENIAEFRNICKNSQLMLNSCLNTATQQQNGGKVYIKDAVAAGSGKSLSVMQGNAGNAQQNQNVNTNASATAAPQTFVNQSVAPASGTQAASLAQQSNNDFLSSIMQAVGIQSADSSTLTSKTQPVQQYTITLDNKIGIKTEPIEYTIAASNASSSQQATEKDSKHNALEEFLRMKPNIKVTPVKKKSEQQQQLQQPVQQVSQQQQHTLQQQQQSVQQQTTAQQQQQQQQFQQQQQNQQHVAQLQLQQLQQQIQQQLQHQWQQQQLQQQLQQLTAQLQPQNQQQQQQHININDALSPSKTKKPKLNFVITSPTNQSLAATLPQLNAVSTTAASQPQIQLQFQTAPATNAQQQQQATTAALLQNLAPFLQQQSSQQLQQNSTLSPNKCYLPITIKDENSDQQIVAHIDAKNFVLPTTYQLQMKLQPQIQTVDGQPIMQLTPTSIPATLQLAPQVISNQTLQTATTTNQQLQQTLQQTNFQQQQKQLPQNVQITSQQILTSPNNLNSNNIGLNSTHDAATSTNDQLEDVAVFANNILDQQQQQQNALSSVKPQTYRLLQQPGSDTIEITPTTNLTQQIMQQVQQQQKQRKLQQLQQQQKKQQEQKQQQQAATSTITTTLPTQHGGITVQRITTTKAAAAKSQQQPKLPVLNKQNVTISRIIPPQLHNQATKKHEPLTTAQQQQSIKIEQQNVLPTINQTTQQQHATNALSQIQQQPQQAAQQQNAAKSKTLPLKRVARLAKPTTTATTTTTTTNNNNTQPHVAPSTDTVYLDITVSDGDEVVAVRNFPSDTANTNNSTNTPNTSIVNIPTEAHGTGPDGLECSQCRRVFKKKEHLTQHVKLHAGVRPFKCTEEGCNKDFSRKEHLLRHIISHTGKKMFNCDVCQKLFSRKDNLNKHKRIHSDQPNSSSYNCEICHKSFANKLYYQQHKLIHEKARSSDAASKVDKNKLQQKPTQAEQAALPQQQQQQELQLQQQQQKQASQQQHQQIQIVQQHQTQQQQQQQQPQIMHLQLPAGVVTTQHLEHLANNTITITQSSDPNNPSLKAIGSHDATVLNLPTSLANFVQLGQAQFVNATTGEIMGHIKIEK